VENVYLGNAEEKIQAEHGKYKVVVKNYSYHTADRTASIPWRVVVQMNGQTEWYFGACQGSGPTSKVVACEFEYFGRTVPFPGDEKASFDASNLVSLTTSTGQTLESISQLVGVMIDLDKLDEVRNLVMEDESNESVERPEEAPSGTLEVTSRERMDMLLAGLPKRFHLAVAHAFGGTTLVDDCAEQISRKMVAENIPLHALSAAGYPPEIVDAVKSKLVSAAASH
jgi:hypothetical protein